MSWQVYVERLVGDHIDKAAIISIAGDSEWATSAGFKLEPAEMKAIADILSNAPGARDRAHADGIHIGGERYVVTVIDDDTIYARQGRSGIYIAKSKRAILVSHHNERAVAPNVIKDTGGVLEYLKSEGF